MAFWDKYKLEVADNLGIVWTVLIQEDSEAGTTTTLTGSGNPIQFEFYGSDDPFEQPIMGSKATIEVQSSTSFVYSDLFTSENLTYKVIIKWGSTVYWNGWILANNYQEPYDCVPFPVSIVATDGLGLLSDFNFKDLAYTTRQKVSVVFHDILELVGIDTFTEFVNVYESTMDQAVGDSPFDQCGIHWELFEAENCYTALAEILKAFNAGIRQDQGVFIIFRFTELKDTSMKGRIYTTGTAKSATTRTPLQYIDRTAQASNFADYNGGTISIVPQYKKLYVNQNYGFRGSFFTNANFPFEQFVYDVDHWDITGWVAGPVNSYFQPVSVTHAQWLETTRALQRRAVYLEDGGPEGVLITNRNLSALDFYYLQTIKALASTDKLIIEIEGSLISYNGEDDIGTMIIQLISTDGTYTQYYHDVDGWDADARTVALQYNKDCSKNLEWKKFSYMIDEIPYTGDFTIRIHAGSDLGGGETGNIMAAYKNISIYSATGDGVVPEGIGYTVSNNISGQVVEKEILLGDGNGFDNDHLQYKGALNVWDGTDIISTSKSWETVTAGTGNNEADALIELIANEIGSQFVRPKQMIDLPLRERHDDEFFRMVGNLQDTSNKTGGVNRIFMPAHGTFSVKMREWYLTLVEIL